MGKFRKTSSAVNVKPRGCPKAVTAPEYTEALCVGIIVNISGSVRKTSQALRTDKLYFHSKNQTTDILKPCVSI